LYEVMNAASGVVARAAPEPRHQRLREAEFTRHAPLPPPVPPGPERRVPPMAEPPQMPVTAAKSQAPLAIFPLASSVPANLEILASAYRNRDNTMHGATKVAADWVARSAAGLNVRRFAIVAVGAGSLASSASTVALARAIAQAGKRVVMLDLVPVEAGVNILAGLPAGAGLVELLAGKTDFTNVVSRDPMSLAHVMRYGMDHSEASAQALHAKIDQVLTTLDNIYDIILINAGELSSTAQTLAGKVQAALLLAPPSRQREVATAVEVLKSSGLEAVEFIGLAAAAEKGEMKASA
jgi:Mrp family chromosome partitioning ATPase